MIKYREGSLGEKESLAPLSMYLCLRYLEKEWKIVKVAKSEEEFEKWLKENPSEALFRVYVLDEECISRTRPAAGTHWNKEQRQYRGRNGYTRNIYAVPDIVVNQQIAPVGGIVEIPNAHGVLQVQAPINLPLDPPEFIDENPR
jgi:hypothetical protein